MKRILFIATLMVTSTLLFSQSPVKFKETKHNFGKIKKDIPATYIFKFTNEGSKPLVIESAVAGCGCTTPEYPKQPILKSKEASIKVTFNAANPGVFTKDVTVKFAGIEQAVVLNINGEVIDAKPAAKEAIKPKAKS